MNDIEIPNLQYGTSIEFAKEKPVLARIDHYMIAIIPALIASGTHPVDAANKAYEVSRQAIEKADLAKALDEYKFGNQ